MTVIDIAMIIIGLSVVPAVYRMMVGPTRADRAIAGDLVTVAVVGLLALVGIRDGSQFTFDIVLIASLVSFLTAIALARALTAGVR
ncbi:monovalent cation/H+ antiporter complex subunit F [Corynebacterium halotolerans]|uniref:PH adaptation potassium efflux system protein n=1 Tax=Corynebacterium halotolerans YIM 70093 = DSM 44683 TaxID=1121362 RepID=M1NN65_9CORY|nr:monovalent cation/H+ antiporter complex subunit F [Corynebacterium halotolerans]AGF72808.1 PH adaptation potassium efflux system protein [Corynebacterium halotolerans YIM 70093 = DSM 44683]